MAHLDGGRFGRWLEKFFNLKSAGQTLYDIRTDVAPIISLQSGVEDRYLQQWDTFETNVSIAAVAAQFSRFQLRNPTGSSVIAVVEQLQFSTPTATVISFGRAQGTADFATVFGSALLLQLDARGRTGSTCILSDDTNASNTPGAAFSPQIWQAPINTSIAPIATVNQEIPILPGNSLWVVQNTVNIGLNVSIRWRERAMESSELT